MSSVIKKVFNKPVLNQLALCVSSGVLLVLSFPRVAFAGLVWVGLVPLIILCERKSLKHALGLGFLTGIVFFAGTLYWFVHVTILGAVLLVGYLSLYVAVFAFFVSYVSSKRNWIKILVLPAAWVILEFIRAHAFTGFGWVSLAHSQYEYTGLIQIADVTGIYGVSFLIVMVNVLLAAMFKEKREGRFAMKNREVFVPMLMVLVLLSAAKVYGFQCTRNTQIPTPLKIAVVQGNIRQEDKWNPRLRGLILKKYFDLTRDAALAKPHLIIWPETALPGYIWEVPELFTEVQEFVRTIKIPLLFGLVVREGDKYYNSAMLLSRQGKVIARYDKMHLVPFGEYIPFRDRFPIISAVVPIGDFTSGEKFTLFPASVPIGDPARDPKDFFSVLICFEDTVSELARQFTMAGTNLLINITNDAWFQDTNQPFLHLQAAVFRTVENRRTLVRVTNTGVSCFIDSFGRIERIVRDGEKKTYIPGFIFQNVSLSDQKTFYTKYGDIFTYLCFGVILLGIKRKNSQIL